MPWGDEALTLLSQARYFALLHLRTMGQVEFRTAAEDALAGKLSEFIERSDKVLDQALPELREPSV